MTFDPDRGRDWCARSPAETVEADAVAASRVTRVACGLHPRRCFPCGAEFGPGATCTPSRCGSPEFQRWQHLAPTVAPC